MSDKEIIKTLQNIKNDIKNKKYNKAIKVIDDKITEIKLNKDSASSYIDNLISELK